MTDMILMRTIFRWTLFKWVCMVGLSCWLPGTVLADGVIRGVVLDKKTQEPVIGAAVVIEHTTTGAATGIDGDFKLERLKAGQYNLKISCISYTSLVVEGIRVRDNQEAEIKVELEEDALNMEEVTVKAVRRMNLSLIHI